MSISKVEVKKFAKLVVEEFLGGKGTGDLQGTTQDHIDAFVIPIMTDVEDCINALLATKIKESFEEAPLEEDDEWWTKERG
jgi:hypothetical protein